MKLEELETELLDGSRLRIVTERNYGSESLRTILPVQIYLCLRVVGDKPLFRSVTTKERRSLIDKYLSELARPAEDMSRIPNLSNMISYVVTADNPHEIENWRFVNPDLNGVDVAQIDAYMNCRNGNADLVWRTAFAPFLHVIDTKTTRLWEAPTYLGLVAAKGIEYDRSKRSVLAFNISSGEFVGIGKSLDDIEAVKNSTYSHITLEVDKIRLPSVYS
jgi:hypothetical protein